MQEALAYRKINPLPDELFYVLFRAAEAMNYPRLLGFVLLPQGDDFVMAPHIMQNHRLLQDIRELDLPLKKFDLSFKTSLVHLVQTCFAEGKDLWQLQFLFKGLQCFFCLKISIIQCPRMDAIAEIAMLGTRLVQVQVDDLNQIGTWFCCMRMYINKRRVHQDAKLAKFFRSVQDSKLIRNFAASLETMLWD